MSKETKVTAVEWLVQQISERQPNGLYVIDSLYDVKLVFEQAKSMQQEQIIEAYWIGAKNWDSEQDAEQYYTETYGN